MFSCEHYNNGYISNYGWAVRESNMLDDYTHGPCDMVIIHTKKPTGRYTLIFEPDFIGDDTLD